MYFVVIYAFFRCKFHSPKMTNKKNDKYQVCIQYPIKGYIYVPIPNWNQWTDEQQGKFQILICEPLQSLSNWSLVIIKSGAKNIHSKTMLSNIDQGFVQFQVSKATWSLSYIWSLLPFSDIVCLNVFLVSIRSSCLFVCLSAGVYVACGSSWPVCMFVCFCPLHQVCLFVSIRSIWPDICWGTM